MSSRKTSGCAERRRDLRRDRRGTTALEFALVAPPFLVLMFGAVQLSIMLHKASSVQWAIERAARSASLDPTMNKTKMQSLVDANLKSVGATDTKVNISYTTEAGAQVTLERISATYVYPLKILFLPEYNCSFVADVTVARPNPT